MKPLGERRYELIRANCARLGPSEIDDLLNVKLGNDPLRDEIVDRLIRLEGVEEMLRELLAATIKDSGDPDDFPGDDGSIGWTAEAGGEAAKGTAVTFDIIRRARAALSE